MNGAGVHVAAVDLYSDCSALMQTSARGQRYSGNLTACRRLRPVSQRAIVSCRAMSSHDLLVVGPGVLGSRAGVLWKEAYPSATVMAQTNTDSSHERYDVCSML